MSLTSGFGGVSRAAVVGLLASLAILSGCGSAEPDTMFTFDDGPEGWVAGFADYPPGEDLAAFELESSWAPLPEGLEGNGVFIQGHNRSDDLFISLTSRSSSLQTFLKVSSGSVDPLERVCGSRWVLPPLSLLLNLTPKVGSG